MTMLWLLALLPIAVAPLLWCAVPRRRGALAAAAGGCMLVTAALALGAVLDGWTGSYAVGAGIELVAALDPVAAALAVLVPLVALPVVVFAAVHEDEDALPRLVAGLVLFVGAMELLVIAADLLTLLVGWELVGACSWALILHPGDDREDALSAARAFVVTRLGDLGLFVAVAAAFAGAESFAYSALATLDGGTLAVVAAGVLLAAASKSAQLPFSPWLFSAMAAPASVSALLHAAAMVAAGAFIVARLHPQLATVPWFEPAVLGVGLATALAGGLVATFQHHGKRLLAASTSAHYGLMFAAVGAGFPAVAVLHLVAHAFMKALLFLAVGAAGAARGTYELARLRVGAALPWVAGAAAAGTVALAGIPPLGAAWTKETVLGAAWHRATWCGVTVALAGGLSAAYAMRLQMLAFGRGEETARGATLAERAPLVALAVVTVVLSFLWWPGAGDAAAGALGGRAPAMRAPELALSLGLVLLGLYAGRLAVRSAPVARSGTPAVVADWLGLPRLGVGAFEHPLRAFVAACARFDDALLDAPARGAARLGPAVATALGRGDDRVVDAGVRAASHVAVVLARVTARAGEAGLDGLAEGLSRIVDAAGADTRRTQTGLAHHYYAAMTVALLVLLAALAAGGR